MSWWVLANLVLTAHIALFAFLAVGVLVAAAGWLRRRSRQALVFWFVLVVTLAHQPVPGCGLTVLERWLRSKEHPGWDREVSLLRTVIETATGARPPAVFDIVFPATLGAIALYAFSRYHLRDYASAIRRRLGRS